ncbi:MAG: PHP domain-containing protein [Chloroflexi bacterium]|nr:PHP domain-containing protein [Chloroflexota bacterium]
MGFADLHIHTTYSYDGTASVRDVLGKAKQLGLNVIAVTDHDEIAGALKAVEYAPKYGVEVIPGSEITTADGDLLAFFIREKVPARLPLVETVLRVRELGGFCIAPHPMAGGMGMKSLGKRVILEALRNPQVADTLLGIETYNASVIDRISNQYAHILASRLDIAHVGNSDAHVVDAIGLGATEFEGDSAADLLVTLKAKSTRVRRQKEWSVLRILGSWGLSYMGNTLTRITGLAWA